MEEDEDEEGDEHPAEEARRTKKARDTGAPSRAEALSHLVRSVRRRAPSQPRAPPCAKRARGSAGSRL